MIHLKTVFDAAVQRSSRWLLNAVFEGMTSGLPAMTDPKARDVRIGAALFLANEIGENFPDLAVCWGASMVAYADPGSVMQREATGLLLLHLDRAACMNPKGAAWSCRMAGLASRDAKIADYLEQRGRCLMERRGPEDWRWDVFKPVW